VLNGKLTGQITGEIIDGERKAELLKELSLQEGLDCEQVIAVGDGANDIAMISAAGLGIAFRAKPKVIESAEQSISQVSIDSILYLLGIADRHHSSI
jgi:phosphoserine phosphatase